MTERLESAFVHHRLGEPPHLSGHEYLGTAAHAHRLEIAADDGSFFLLRFSEAGELVGESWHASLEDAKRQAALEYSLSDWKSVPPA